VLVVVEDLAAAAAWAVKEERLEKPCLLGMVFVSTTPWNPNMKGINTSSEATASIMFILLARGVVDLILFIGILILILLVMVKDVTKR
jgi:hypothetical protein